MKKTAIFLLCLSMLTCTAVTAAAQGTDEPKSANIGTEVPAVHKVTVKLIGEGEASLDDKTGDTFTVDRLSEPTLSVTPAKGCKITKVTKDGEDITAEAKDGEYTLPPVYQDVYIEVTIESDGKSSSKSDDKSSSKSDDKSSSKSDDKSSSKSDDKSSSKSDDKSSSKADDSSSRTTDSTSPDSLPNTATDSAEARPADDGENSEGAVSSESSTASSEESKSSEKAESSKSASSRAAVSQAKPGGSTANPATGVVGGVSLGSGAILAALALLRHRNKDEE